jgi:hypothetical protein
MKVNHTKQRRAASNITSPLRINSHPSILAFAAQQPHLISSINLLFRISMVNVKRPSRLNLPITIPSPIVTTCAHHTLVYASGAKYSYHHPTLQLN